MSEEKEEKGQKEKQRHKQPMGDNGEEVIATRKAKKTCRVKKENMHQKKQARHDEAKEMKESKPILDQQMESMKFVV